MGRLLFFILLGFLVYLLVKGIFRHSARKNLKQTEGKAVERMVECAYCGVNLPESESLSSDGKYFCSEEHRRLAR